MTVAGSGWLRGVDFYAPEQIEIIRGRVEANFHATHGCPPNLTEPKGFNEWVVWSLFNRPMKVPESGNKLLTSSFIPSRLQGRLRCPTILWSGSRLNWLELDGLSSGKTCYLKSNHGSMMYRRLFWPPDPVMRFRLADLTTQWLGYVYGLDTGEWWYDAFPPMLLVETDVGGNGFSVNCFSFKGEVGLVVLYSKATHERITLGPQLDLIEQSHGCSDWRNLFGLDALREIRELASELSQDNQFARYDFLVGASSEIFLGEVTFAPGGGASIRPEGVDERLGRLWAESAGP